MAYTERGAAITDLILEVFRVNGDLLRAGDRLTSADAQTSSRWQVLGALAEDPRSVATIARDMGLTRQSVQRTADLLEREGLVAYTDNPAHRRAKLVRLTGRGEKVLDRISRRQMVWANDLGRAIRTDPRRIRDSLEVLRRLRAELERPGDAPRVARAPEARRQAG